MHHLFLGNSNKKVLTSVNFKLFFQKMKERYDMFKYFALAVIVSGVMLFGCSPKEENISVKTVGATKCVFISGQGNYSEVGLIFGKLFEWLIEKDVNPIGPPFGIYYDNPKEVPLAECRYDVCVPIKVEIESDSLVQIKEICEMEVASLMYKGPYDKVGASWEKLYSWVYKNKYEPAGPGMEVYLNSPAEVSADSLLTEIQIPVKKK